MLLLLLVHGWLLLLLPTKANNAREVLLLVLRHAEDVFRLARIAVLPRRPPVQAQSLQLCQQLTPLLGGRDTGLTNSCIAKPVMQGCQLWLSLEVLLPWHLMICRRLL